MEDYSFVIYEDPVNVAVNDEPVPAIESGKKDVTVFLFIFCNFCKSLL